jgi:hypothetical protein
MNDESPDHDPQQPTGTPNRTKQELPVDVIQTMPKDVGSADAQQSTKAAFHPWEWVVARWRDGRKGESAKWTDKAIVILTAGIVFLAFMQWLEMHEGGAQTDKIIAADDRIATAMEGAVGQAKTSFEAANKQAILSQRAWVGFGIRIQNPNPKDTNPPEEPLKAGTVVDVRSTIKNTGRTPAIHIRGVLQKIPIKRAKDGSYPSPTLTATLKPYENLNPDGELYGDALLPFTQDDKKLIDSGDTRVFFVGRIEYDDVFGGSHWRNTCAYLLPSGAFAMCEGKNDIDQNAN